MKVFIVSKIVHPHAGYQRQFGDSFPSQVGKSSDLAGRNLSVNRQRRSRIAKEIIERSVKIFIIGKHLLSLHAKLDLTLGIKAEEIHIPHLDLLLQRILIKEQAVAAGLQVIDSVLAEGMRNRSVGVAVLAPKISPIDSDRIAGGVKVAVIVLAVISGNIPRDAGFIDVEGIQQG